MLTELITGCFVLFFAATFLDLERGEGFFLTFAAGEIFGAAFFVMLFLILAGRDFLLTILVVLFLAGEILEEGFIFERTGFEIFGDFDFNGAAAFFFARGFEGLETFFWRIFFLVIIKKESDLLAKKKQGELGAVFLGLKWDVANYVVASTGAREIVRQDNS